MTGLTHNQFIKLFSDIAVAHKDINSFGSGSISEYLANESATIDPVTLWVDVVEDSIDGKTDQVKYTFLVMDQVDKDLANFNDVISDTLRIAKDIVSIISQPYYEDFFVIDRKTTLNDFRQEKFDNEFSGWQFDIVFKQPFLYDACSINMDSLPVVNQGPIYINTTTAVWGTIIGTLSNQTDLQNALNAKENSITAGTTAQYWRGDKSWQTLDKSAVGLSNVDNTSDVNKPVSTATQTALNLKEDLSNKTNTVTGNETSTTLYLSVKGYYDYLITLAWLTAQIFGTWINGLASKTTPVDADYIPLMDSADTNKSKKVSWANIKATLKTYFDTLYSPVKTKTTDTQSITGTSMTLPNNPSFIYGMYRNGQFLTPTTDYSRTGTAVTFVDTLASDLITTVYEY